jgi:hypothetical protein
MKTNSISAGHAVHVRTLTTTRYLRFPSAWLWTGFLAFATIAFGPPPAPAPLTEAWVQRYGSEVGSEDRAYKVVTDAAGNVIVAGTSTHNQTGSGSDMLVIKYSGAGVPLWTNRCDGSARAMAVDASGNVFVTGSLGYDYATIKYSGAGVLLWTNRYRGAPTAVAVDGSGNVFVTGTSTGKVNEDYATVAYSSAGVPLWTNRFNGSVRAVAVDAIGNVFVTGYSDSSSHYDYVTIAYSGAGVVLWANRYNGPGNISDQATAVAVDGSGNVFVTGSSTGSGGDSDYATIKYSGAGVPLWTNRYNGPGNIADQATAVAVDARGNVFVTGYSGYSNGSVGNHDYVTIAYSGVGVPLWTNNVSGTAIALDGSGNVFVTGSSGTIAYSGAGVPLCTNRYGGSDLAIGSDGAVYVTGASDGLFSSDFATVKYVWQTEIAIQLLSTIPPKVNLTLSGAPNSSWAIERALELTGPWTNLSALLIGPNGSAQFLDTNSPNSAGFYRAIQQ